MGASPGRSWAFRTHLPALSGLPGLELTAVATTRRESAEESARRFGARLAFDDPLQLCAHPEVDVVAVCVKVPDHAGLVRAAIGAGKHVYCEWPLGRSTDEATGLAELAESAGVKHAVGLQGRKGPTVNYLRHLIADGYVGDVLSVSLTQRSSGRGGPEVHTAEVWATRRENGATLLTITAGHSIDLLRHLLGELDELSAFLAVRHPLAKVSETGEPIEVTSPDVVLVQGRLRSGAYFSIDVQGGVPTASGTRLEIAGAEGTLLLEASGNLQMDDRALRLRGARGADVPAPLEVPDEYRTVPASVPDGTARNTAAVYLDLEAAIRGGGTAHPGFSDAVALHRVVDAITAAAGRG